MNRVPKIELCLKNTIMCTHSESIIKILTAGHIFSESAFIRTYAWNYDENAAESTGSMSAPSFARGRNHNYMAHRLRYQGKGAAFGQINPLLMSLLKSRLFSSETLYPLINIGKLRALKSQVPRKIFVF